MEVPTLEEYQIGWICALPIEAAAAQEMLDENFGPLEEQDNSDTNIYTLGRIGKHLVAIACVGGQYGTTSATTVANNMMRTFSKSLRVGLMVGIGGGIPSAIHDIRLGDIVVSYPTGTCGGVVQHDMGKVGEGGRLTRTGSLNSPPRLLLAAVNQMRAAALREDPLYPSYIRQAVQRNSRTRRNFGRPDQQMDRLFQIQHEHPPSAATCDGCLDEWEVKREKREDNEPQPHYGIIASGNAVIKHGILREQLWKEIEALCFEMEAAGLMQDFPCVVIRGICDYADSHKNGQWQGYAALAAASYAKELLRYVPRGRVSQEKLVAEITSVARELKRLNQTTKEVERKIDLQGLSIAKGAAFDSYENQDEICLDGTRVALLHDIEEWATSQAGKCIFWLNGKAGTGKSTISRTIAKRLQQRGLLGASFFFKRGEENRSNAKRLFPTLIRQLMCVIPQIRPEIQKAIQSDPYISERALGEQFDKLVLKPLLNVDLKRTVPMVIVIDALDECESGIYNDIKAILRLLPQVQLSKGIQLRFFVTSRPELPIQWVFEEIEADHENIDLYDVPLLDIRHDISIYLREEFSKIRLQHRIPLSWPGEEAIQVLLARTVPLFISAATLCRFINGSWDPRDRLERVIVDQSIYASTMASTYLPVLKQLFVGQSKRETQRLVEDFKRIIGSIITLATPLPVFALSKLLHVDAVKIQKLLDRLHSVLNVPGDSDQPVRILHLSFRDFLLDEEMKEIGDAKQFWIDKETMHRNLTHQCLELMSSRLKRNICKLSGDGTLRCEIELQAIEHHLPPELQYACRYWTEHLSQCLSQVSQLTEVFLFLRTHFLHWLEVMSILGYISEVVRVIVNLQSIIQSQRYPEISGFLYDAKRFILKNRQIAETAPLQLYSSALVFCPRRSITRENFKNNLSIWLELPRVKEEWSAELQTLEGHSHWVESVTFSPDGRLLASGSYDKTIKLWDPSTGELCQTLEGHSHPVKSVTFSPDGRLLASDKQWICLRGKRILWLSPEYRASCLALKGNVFALGHVNGWVSFLSLEL
ncbi:WD domain protein [Aspergillus lucknowensis]|uniref:WD domain protein n=1 Tax=Aspergillus lucknowensis TaxID=176173 RepID=A0ABR4L6N3_9EURO